MKRLISLTAILAIIVASNCSRVPENNDPVIGIWSKVGSEQLSTTEKLTVRQEWIFNDAYLGRYHRYHSKNLVFKTDFRWQQTDGLYTIEYPGTDLEKQQVMMKETAEGTLLQDVKGEILAQRE